MTFNPLRDPRDRRIPRVAGPCVLVMFGVTGDLSRKKLMPAVYDLANRGLLPPGFSLVGFARRDWEDEDFEQLAHDAVKAHARTPFQEDVWKQVSQGIRFVPGEFDDDEAFERLEETVDKLDAQRGTRGITPSTCRSRRRPSRWSCSSSSDRDWPAPPDARGTGGGWSSRSRSGTTWRARAS